MIAGMRGYAVTGQEKFLVPYDEGIVGFEVAMGDLEATVEASAQITHLREIKAMVQRHQAFLEQVIEARRKVVNGVPGADLATVYAFIESGEGELLINSIRDQVEKFVEVEDGILEELNADSDAAARQTIWFVIVGTLLAIGLGVVGMLLTSRTILRQVGGEPALIAGIADEIAKDNLDVDLGADPTAGSGIRSAIGQMLISLRLNKQQAQRQNWLKTGLARLNDVTRGDPDLDTLVTKVISEMATYLDAQVGVFYLAQDKSGRTSFVLKGSYAYTKRKNLSNVFELGEGLVGQAALEKQQILLKNVPEDYLRVTSGLGDQVPRFICVTPFSYEDQIKGVIELGTLNEMTEKELEYLSLAMPALGISVQTADSRTALARALQEAQKLAEELQTQQEELRVSNEELEEQTQRLGQSEQELKSQQEELQVTNEELEEKNELLERQKRAVELARKDIEEKAEEVALASKYKSEFLANMSHELRTPLNSLLLLAQGLTENKEGNLSPEQVHSAQIIHGGGNDLLNLINEILDLSKIEAGRMDVQIHSVKIEDLMESYRAWFGHMVEKKGLALELTADSDCPTTLSSDRKRLDQIVKNLLSNAIKFTEVGTIRVHFGRPLAGTNLGRSGLVAANCLAIAVSDTGIGVAHEKQKLIFEAFQQAEGGTARRYGGTGLGLSISRELARLLGGKIGITSELGQGSTFTLYLPLSPDTERAPFKREVPSSPTKVHSTSRVELTKETVSALQIEDDREHLRDGDQVILVIEDDPNFAKILYQSCHDKGFKALVTPTGEAGLELASKHLPIAVILDLRLPGMDGWAVLAELKASTRTRHIPVHVVSVEEASAEALRQGAVGHATKPLTKESLAEAFRKLEEVSAGKPRRLLVVEDDPDQRQRTVKLIGNYDVQVDEAETGKQALAAMRANTYDCVVLDLGLPDMDGLTLLELLEEEGLATPPVIIHTARDLTREQEAGLREHAQSIVIKDVRSQERLLDEVSLFLHRVVSRMPESKRQIIRNLHDTDELLRDKKIMVVDDDMRTVFAMSQFLSGRGMKPLKAENGAKALELLEKNSDIDLVLMDIMMPVMDGYEAIAKIRAQDKFRRLPIIALTAKAMKEDRAKCIAAGANDYLSKPVDQSRLISIMRVWLYR